MTCMSPLPHCYVCEVKFTDSGGPLKRHEHHIVPRAYGGSNGPLCSVCTNHHNLLHELALSIIGGKSSVTESILDSIDGNNQVLIRSRLLYLATRIVRAYKLTKHDPNKRGKVIITLTGEQHKKANMLKNDLGFKSMQSLFTTLLEQEWIKRA